MIPKDEQFYDQLIGHLTRNGRVTEDAGHGVLVLTEFDHRSLSPPLRLHATAVTFGPHLRAAAPEAAGSYPDIHPVEAAWRLFVVQLAEAVRAAAPDETELVLDGTGVLARRPST